MGDITLHHGITTIDSDGMGLDWIVLQDWAKYIVSGPNRLALPKSKVLWIKAAIVAGNYYSKLAYFIPQIIVSTDVLLPGAAMYLPYIDATTGVLSTAKFMQYTTSSATPELVIGGGSSVWDRSSYKIWYVESPTGL